jgi:hypothetical protein
VTGLNVIKNAKVLLSVGDSESIVRSVLGKENYVHWCSAPMAIKGVGFQSHTYTRDQFILEVYYKNGKASLFEMTNSQ